MIQEGPVDEVAPPPERAPEPSKRPLVLGVMGSLLAVDLASKAWIQGNLSYGHSLSLWGDWVRLTYLLNPGAAFGLNVGEWSRTVFATLAIVAVGVILMIVRETPAQDRVRLSALALILGGALGNLLDRLRSHGAVVDFLDVGFGGARWPVFNIADVGVTTGAILLVALLWGDRGSPAALPSAGEPTGGSDPAPAP